MPYDIVDRFDMWKLMLIEFAAAPEVAVRQAIKKLYPDALTPNAAAMSRLLLVYVPAVKQSAEEALSALCRNQGETLALLVRRPFLTLRILNGKDKTSEELTADYLGVDEAEFGPKLLVETKLYMADVRSMHARDASAAASIDTIAYFNAKKDAWPEFVSLAFYWLAFASSNLPCERGFGMAPQVAVPSRSSQLISTLAREIMFRFNKGALASLLNEELTFV